MGEVPSFDADVVDSCLPDDLTVVSVIRSGGQRAVYSVKLGDQIVVLKLMPIDAWDRAERESTLGQAFDHENLARILTDPVELEVSGTACCYFLEELVEGTSLDEIGARLSASETVDLMADLSSATQYLFEVHSVVHRDIKPPNIILRPDGGFTLIDPGVARHQNLDTLTHPFAIHGPGTPGFLAPEQLNPQQGSELDSRCDQFAIGIVAFLMLTGRIPFDPSLPTYIEDLYQGNIEDWSAVPEELEPVLRRMLNPKPHRRYRAAKLQAQLEEMRQE